MILWLVFVACALVLLSLVGAVRRSRPQPGPAPAQRRRIPTEVRRRVLRRDGWQCPCGATRDLTIDHIRPLARGGTDDERNLRTLCRSCNSSKGVRIYGKAA